MKFFIYIIFFILFINYSYSQTRQNYIDSIENILLSQKNDTNKIVILNNSAFELRNTNIEIAKKYALQAEILAKRLNNKKGMALAQGLLGILYYREGDYDLALEKHFESLKISQEIGNKQYIAFRFNDIANIYADQENYKEAIYYHLKSLKIKEEINDIEGIATSYNNISSVYYRLNEIEKSEEFAYKAFELAEKFPKPLQKNYVRVIGITEFRFAEILFARRKFDQAINKYNKALDAAYKSNYTLDIPLILTRIGDTYYEQYMTYWAIKYYTQALDTSEYYKIKKDKFKIYWGFTKVYEYLNDVPKAYHYYKLYEKYKDEMYNEASIIRLNNIQEKLEVQKKTTQIEILTRDAQLNENKLKEQRYFIYVLISVFSVIFIFSIALYRMNKKRKKINDDLIIQKTQLLEKNEEIRQQNEQISLQRQKLIDQNQEIETQRDTLEIQKNTLEKYFATAKKENLKLTDSITYAKRIQTAILPKEDVLKKYFVEQFILFKPKDIVSGDFFFIKSINNNIIVAAADCTGHGVPGAFMSILGIALLNDIVRKNVTFTASQILDELRIQIKNALHQSGDDEASDDSIDIAYCIINKDLTQMQFAGAGHPLWLLRNNQLLEFSADLMSVGILGKNKLFTNHLIELQKNDIIYLFSDGYYDQIGGPENRKFLSTQFKQLLLKVHTIPLSEQKKILIENFYTWKGNQFEQIDDILIIGFKI